MQKKLLPAERKQAENLYRQLTKNAMVVGSGSNTEQDRGAGQGIAWSSSNPFFQVNYLFRWMLWTRWYYTDWAAAKVVNIPVDDALRKPFVIKGISDDEATALMKEYERLNFDRQLRRALKQERLLGGSIIYMAVADSSTSLEAPINYEILREGNLQSVNVIDLLKISQPGYTIDCLSPDYDKPHQYLVDRRIVDNSRLIINNGDPLYNRAAVNLYMPWRANPSGFGESILTPLHDLLVRVTGTQEGAYHLVNLASVLLMKIDNLKIMSQNAKAAIQEMLETISLYRAGLIQGKESEIQQHSASFGSVPELIMTFLQILSAGSDIPATRFLSTAPGPLNTGGGDEAGLENYYNTIDSLQRLILKPKLKQVFKVIGCCLFGYEHWMAMEKVFDLEFPPLWNMDEKEQADMNEVVTRTYMTLYDARMINDKQLFDELQARDIFRTDIEFDVQLAEKREELADIDKQNAEIGLDNLKNEAMGGDEEDKTKTANAVFSITDIPDGAKCP